MVTIGEVVDDRVSGLAAEMAFFALLSLVPLAVTISALIGYLERAVGADTVNRTADALVAAAAVVFSAELVDDVLDPFVRGLLEQERGGLALGSLVIALYLASRVFTATIRALDLAYDVPERRGAMRQRGLAILLAIGFVVVTVLTLGFMVVGPLLGGGQSVARALGLGDFFAAAWAIGRWPMLLAIMIAFLTAVYRFAPNLETRWRHSLPGALLGVTLWLLATIGFRLYLEAGGAETRGVLAEDQAVAIVTRVVGAMVAAIIWTYLTSFAILVGGELNSVLGKHER